MTDTDYPLTLFRFQVDFYQVSPSGEAKDSDLVPLCRGAFSDCSGLEATMEPKVIRSGGWNYGAPQRPGPVTFATVILKRGITPTRHLWKWFSHVNELGKSAFRLNVKISVGGQENTATQTGTTSKPQMIIWLYRALPVRFRSGDLNAKGGEVGIEELHLAHEGLAME